MRVLPKAPPWSHMSQGPYVLERQNQEGTIHQHHLSFVEVMRQFWADIGQPAVRHVYDHDGVLILGEVTGMFPELVTTNETTTWCMEFLPPDAAERFGYLFAFFYYANGQEE